MIEFKKRDLLIEVIEGVSSRINYKALDRALSYDVDDLNYTLKRYYDEAHYIKENNFMFWEFMELNDEEDYQYIKSFSYPPKRYKKLYNYKRGELTPIKQRDTRFGMEFSNGFYTRFTYLFNVYEYVSLNKIKVID